MTPFEIVQDAERFIWWFSDIDKGDFLNEYMRGMREHWTLDQWRIAIDRAMGIKVRIVK